MVTQPNVIRIGLPPETLRLTLLRPQFLRYEKRDGQVYLPNVDHIMQAQGIQFLCPKCFVENGGSIGTHSVICWSRSRGVPDDARPGPGRWSLDGIGYDDLTLDTDVGSPSRSVLLTSGCRWHGFVTKGRVSSC